MACLVNKKNVNIESFSFQQAHGSPEWLQPTYNLETQLSQLIGDYNVRRRDGLNNLWILKPWNMARTIDTTVTDNLTAIIRLMETGPKICQKYIEHPALFNGKKFDLRYIVLVRGMNPLEIFLSDVFWVCASFFGVMLHRCLYDMNLCLYYLKMTEEHFFVAYFGLHLRYRY
jgi:tubulin--tyrosine ligase-like protein 12